MKKIITILFLIIGMAILSCNDDPVISDQDIVFPDSDVSYQYHVEPFMRLKCSYRGCHSAEDRKAGRDMTTYFSLFETANVGLILPNKPEQSRLIQILKANPPHQGFYTFPEGYFQENHVKGMITWINEGAELN